MTKSLTLRITPVSTKFDFTKKLEGRPLLKEDKRVQFCVEKTKKMCVCVCVCDDDTLRNQHENNKDSVF